MCPLFLIRLSLFLMCMFIDDSNDVMIICNLLRNMMVEVTSYLVTTTERLHVVLLIRFCCTIDLLVWSSIAKSLNDDCSSLNDGPPGCSGATIFDTLIEQTFHPFAYRCLYHEAIAAWKSMSPPKVYNELQCGLIELSCSLLFLDGHFTLDENFYQASLPISENG